MLNKDENNIINFVVEDSQVVQSERILYTASPFARASLLYLQEIGKLFALKPHISKHNNISSYLFFGVLSGEGTVTYDDVIYNLKKGDCVFLDCHNSFAHETSADNLWKLQWCHFFGSTMSLIYNKYLERGGAPVFTPDNVDEYRALLENIYITASGNDYVRDMRINSQLSSLLTLLMEESWHKREEVRKASTKQSVLPVKEYLDINYPKKITMDDLSKDFLISKNYLARLFKEQFGMSVKEYLQVVRITHAKQLLRTTNLSAEEIGLKCGFGELYYFSRVFKMVEGVSLTAYRSQW